MDEGFRFKCSSCDEWHEGIPDLGFDAPYYYLGIAPEERQSRTQKSDDLCTIDDEFFFVRGVIKLPILGRHEEFGIGAWVSLKRENFERYVELFESEDVPSEGPYFGWLCNRIVGYPDTLDLKTNLHLRPLPNRPLIELERTPHPLAVHQHEGISWEEVRLLIERALHPHDDA